MLDTYLKGKGKKLDTFILHYYNARNVCSDL